MSGGSFATYTALAVIGTPLFLLLPAMLCAASPIAALTAIFFAIRHCYQTYQTCGVGRKADEKAEEEFETSLFKGHRNCNVIAAAFTVFVAPAILLALIPVVSVLLPLTATAGTLSAVGSQFIVIPCSVVAAGTVALAAVAVLGRRAFYST